ncbi:MAG: hypothetical protein IPH04_13295 [Saprospirales bacterium]|nr:hypothetical protein [Saprospirales bacterium]
MHAVNLLNNIYSGKHTKESFTNYISENKSFNIIPFENKSDVNDEYFFKEYINYVANDNVLFYILEDNYFDYLKISISIDEKVNFKNKFEKQLEWIGRKSHEKSKYQCSKGFAVVEERLSKLKEDLVKEMKQFTFDNENSHVISKLRKTKEQINNPNIIKEQWCADTCFFIDAGFLPLMKFLL